MSSLQELLAQRFALEEQISAAQQQEKAAAIARVKALMAEHGLTVVDLGLRAPAPGRKRASKVAPKFRHPESGETWSGRGLQPNWLKSAVAEGARLADFKVEP